MTLPDSANTITGGCSCGAIRYRIAIPPLSSRLLSPLAPPSANVRLPQVLTCHCNDCRRITGSFLPVAVIDLAAPMLTVSAMSPASETTLVSGRILDVLKDDYDAEKADSERPPYVPAVDVLRATRESDTWLRFFHSAKCGEDFSRSFCGRCGTQLCYHFQLRRGAAQSNEWKDVFHLYLGTIDREFHDKGWLVPDAEIHFKYGTQMSKSTSATAVGLRDVPKMQELAAVQGVVSEEELKELGQ